MKTINLGLAIHNHQPVGNYGFVFDQAYHDAYLPFLECLERHPGVRITMHISGPLLDWVLQSRPEYVRRLAALCERGQVEMMTGGYYEPILPMVPDDDKLGQIAKMSETIGRLFGQQPAGLWLTERVWEPHLPSVLARAGVGWTLVDDTHFKLTGLEDSVLDGYYVTEEGGRSLKVYPGSKALRYSIPWHEVDEVIDFLRSQAGDDPARILILGDDGEKFGGWPTTYEHCWTKGWVDRFFAALEKNAAWLRVVPLGEHAGRHPGRGIVYLPTASYHEMMEWALPAPFAAELQRLAKEAEESGRDDLRRHLHGGLWRSFFAKYPEANAMHKRMLRVSDKVRRAPDATAAARARDLLWQGQCNCPYWHGVFGGLYLRHIRWATHRNLVLAELEADRLFHPKGPWLDRRRDDVDLDGQEEVLVQTADLSLCFHPALGGMLSEWDLRGRGWNLLNVLARRREAYHQSLLEADAPGAGLRQPTGDETGLHSIHEAVAVRSELASVLVYDDHRRGGLQEHLLPMATGVEDFAAGRRPTSDLLAGPWTAAVEEDAGGVTVRQRTAARVPGGGTIDVEKTVTLPTAGTEVSVRYALASHADAAAEFRFVSEWNLSAEQAPDGDDRIQDLRAGSESLDASAAVEVGPVAEVSLAGSAGRPLACRPDPPARLWSFPVDSVSNSEGGLERVNQGLCLAFGHDVQLQPGETRHFTLDWRSP